jgi:hypothetical protein
LANGTACEILGLRFDELTRRYTSDFAGETLLEDGSPCPPEAYPVSRCLVTGEPQPPMTIGVRQPSGDVRWAIFTAIPAAMDGGGGAVVTFVDITERRRAELERREMLLRVARAERLASLGTLAAGLAHELNNPLTFILGNLEVALDSAEPDPERLDPALKTRRPVPFASRESSGTSGPLHAETTFRRGPFGCGRPSTAPWT